MTNVTHNSFLCVFLIFNSLHISSTSCSSSGETNCVNTTSGSCHSVSVAVSFVGRKFACTCTRHSHRQLPEFVLTQFVSPDDEHETCRELKIKINTQKRIMRHDGHLPRIFLSLCREFPNMKCYGWKSFKVLSHQQRLLHKLVNKIASDPNHCLENQPAYTKCSQITLGRQIFDYFESKYVIFSQRLIAVTRHGLRTVLTKVQSPIRRYGGSNLLPLITKCNIIITSLCFTIINFLQNLSSVFYSGIYNITIFRQVRKISKSYYQLWQVCLSLDLSVHPHGRAWLTLNGFSRNFIFELFFENLSRKFKFL